MAEKYSGFQASRRCNVESAESSNLRGFRAMGVIAALKLGSENACPATAQNVLLKIHRYSPDLAARLVVRYHERWADPCSKCGSVPETKHNIQVRDASRSEIRLAEHQGEEVIDASMSPERARGFMKIKSLIQSRFTEG